MGFAEPQEAMAVQVVQGVGCTQEARPPERKYTPNEGAKRDNQPARDSKDKTLRNKFYETLTRDQWKAMQKIYITLDRERHELKDALDPITTTMKWDVRIKHQLVRKGSFLTGAGQVHMCLAMEAKERISSAVLPAELTYIPPEGLPRPGWDPEKDPLYGERTRDIPGFGKCRPALDIGYHGTKNAFWEVIRDVWEHEDIATFSKPIKVLKKGYRFHQERIAYKVVGGPGEGLLRVKIKDGGWTTISLRAQGGPLFLKLVFLHQDATVFFNFRNESFHVRSSDPEGGSTWGFPNR